MCRGLERVYNEIGRDLSANLLTISTGNGQLFFPTENTSSIWNGDTPLMIVTTTVYGSVRSTAKKLDGYL